jgi:hypothetical protein
MFRKRSNMFRSLGASNTTFGVVVVAKEGTRCAQLLVGHVDLAWHYPDGWLEGIEQRAHALARRCGGRQNSKIT